MESRQLTKSETRFSVVHVRIVAAKPFEKARADFEAQLGRFDEGAYHLLAADSGVEAARASLEKMPGPSGFVLFAKQDHGGLLRLAGVARRAVQYIVGNPLFAIQMTQHAVGAALYAPLRVLLYESGAGQTTLEYDRPSTLVSQFDDERATQVAAMLDHKLEDLAAAALR